MNPFRGLPAILVVVLASGFAFAGEKDGVSMPNTVSVGGTSLVLNGMGTREATILKIDVYVGGLYLESKSSNGTSIASSKRKKRLVLKFVRDVDRGDICKAWSEGFAKNAPGSEAALKARLDRLTSWMTDVKKGQQLTFTYESGKGVEVNIDGGVKGTIKGDDFARAFFLIWLGADPPNEGLKSGLLGH